MGNRGSGTVLALALMGLIAALFSAMVLVVGAQQKASRVQVVADLVALGASDIDRGVVVGRPCRDARALGRDNGAAVVDCDVENGVATVSVRGVVYGFTVVKTATAAPAVDDVWQERR